MTKIHHSAQPPHEVCILFNYSRLSTKIWSKILSKSPSQKLYKTSQITCPQRLLTSNLWKHPMHYDQLKHADHEVTLLGMFEGWKLKRTWPTIYTIDRVKETRKDCGYRLTKTRWILPLLSAMSVDGASLLKEWQPIIVNFSEKFTIRYHIYMHILYCII